MNDTLTDRCQKNPGSCLILTLVWASENTAFSTHVGPYKSMKRLAAGALPQIAPTPILFKEREVRRGQEKRRGGKGEQEEHGIGSRRGQVKSKEGKGGKGQGKKEERRGGGL